jgi:hypothetical protein
MPHMQNRNQQIVGTQSVSEEVNMDDHWWDRRAEDILRVETLTLWCRRNIEPPPAAILYDAVSAIERLKQEARDAST